MDLIDRQEAIKALCKAGCDSGHCGVSCPDVMAIEHLPSVDAVEVIRCKECYHYDEESEKCILNNSEMKPIDYCSYGSK